MTAEAIRAAAAEFGDCLAGLWPLAARRGITRETFERYTAGLTPDLSIMDLLDAQPEFTKSTWDYLDPLVSDERIARGREMLAQHAPTFAAVERDLWRRPPRHRGNLGRRVEIQHDGRRPPGDPLDRDARLCRPPPRLSSAKSFSRRSKSCSAATSSPSSLIGSWAGAFGPTQFMPTTFKRYAVDFDGDGRRDVVDSVPDMIASTANNLKRTAGPRRRAGATKSSLPHGLRFHARRPLAADDVASMGRARRRARRRPAVPACRRARLSAGAGGRAGPGFLMLQNFRVIMKYNPAEAYALAIGHLPTGCAAAVRSLQAWPREERVLTLRRTLRAAAAPWPARLRRRRAGRPPRPGTRIAIRNFQATTGQIPGRVPSSDVLDRLRAAVTV